MEEASKADTSLINHLNLWSQRVRGNALKPLLHVFATCHIQANDITNIRFAGSFCAPLLYLYNPLWSMVLLLLLYGSDAIDGPLARYQDTASDRGKFLDICADTGLYIAILIILVFQGFSPIGILYNLGIVSGAYLLSIIHKEEFRKSDWIIKPYPKLLYLKALVVLPFFIFAFTGFRCVIVGILISNISATILVFYFWFQIQKRWKKMYGSASSHL